MLGEAAGPMLAVNQLAVGLYVKDSTTAPDQFDLHAVLLLDRGRQTGGCRLVVSFATILDADFHEFPPDFVRGVVREHLHLMVWDGSAVGNMAASTPPGSVGDDVLLVID
jgi:hypothetical protein